jgi:hypothetical protein
MTIDESELPILNISLNQLEIIKIFEVCYNAHESSDKNAKLLSQHAPLFKKFYKFIWKKDLEESPEELVDINSYEAYIYKNLRDKFETILIDNFGDEAIEAIKAFKEMKKKEKKIL